MRGSIRKRLTLVFIGLALGPLLLVGIILAWQSFITQEQQALNLQRVNILSQATSQPARRAALEAALTQIDGQIQAMG